MISAKADDLEQIKAIFARHAPHLAVWAFGSRLTDEHRRYSDLDLVLITNKALDLGTLAKIHMDFQESNIPIRVDLSDWSLLSDEFKKMIEARHEVLISSS